jgi:hypothetical protein
MLLFFGRKICQLLMSDLFSIKTFVIGDGNCFFRAVSLDLTGKEEHFNYVREIACDEIEKNQSYYEPYISTDFYLHVQSMRKNKGGSTSVVKYKIYSRKYSSNLFFVV